ncbi:hypothetical protein [Actinomadura hibisca]|uniref:hypothetical protein n=1 Tax=Actinomadura hibisca TaxID=68565 RepID=UPI00082DE377|nr:hypothetical protein [Actinomadura hibisca]
MARGPLPKGGPLAGVGVALAAFLVPLAVIREGLGLPSLGPTQLVNDLSVIALAPWLAQCVLAAAALGIHQGTDPADRDAGPLGRRSVRAMAVTAAVLLLSVPTLFAVAVTARPSGIGVVRTVAATLVALALGIGLGRLSARGAFWRAATITVAAAFGGALAARAILLLIMVPEVDVLPVAAPTGEVLAAFDRLARWSPVVLGATAAPAVLLGGRRLPRGGRLLAVAALPALLYAVATAVSMILTGPSLPAPAELRAFAWFAAGGLLGAAPLLARRRRSTEPR